MFSDACLAPFLPQWDEALPVEGAAKPASFKTSAVGFSILIVDDEDATRELCRDIALEMGLEVHTASTTSEALETLEQSPVDVVVTDLRVPQLGGLELLKRIGSSQQAIRSPSPASSCANSGTVKARSRGFSSRS